MHELSLVHSICTAVTESARQHGLTRIYRVRLVVGSECLVLPDALLFAFHHLKREPLTPDAVLEIHERPGSAFFIDHFEGDDCHQNSTQTTRTSRKPDHGKQEPGAVPPP